MAEAMKVTLGHSRRSEILWQMAVKGGVVIIHNAFSRETAAQLTDEARQLAYVDLPKEYGPRRVQQDVASAMILKGSRLWRFGDIVQDCLANFFGSDWFESPLDFTHRNVQRYLDGTRGIGRHRDESCNRNLVVLCALSGSGRFSVYSDLISIPLWRMVLNPGSLLLIEAPGYKDREVQPVHSVDQIQGERYILGLRQFQKKED